MRANVLLMLCLCICSTCFAATPVVRPVTAESKTVTVTTTLPWAHGVTSISLELYLADAQGACSVVAANKLTLSPAGSYSVPAGVGSSDLTLSAPLTAGQTICAIETDSTGAGPQPPISSAVITVAVKDTSTVPSIASATADSNTLAVKSPPFPAGKEISTASYAVYEVDAGKPCAADASKELAVAAGTKNDATPSASTTLTLVTRLKADTSICAVETFLKQDGKTVVGTEPSNVVVVSSPEANWGRVRAYFTGGILITNDDSAFSSAHQFYALTLEKTWHLPRCYLSSDCVGSGSVDLSGGTLVGKAKMTISGGTIQLGTPIEIRNATIKVQGAEQISMGNDSIGLPKDSEFVVIDATLDGSATALPEGVSEIAVGGKLRIREGRSENKQTSSRAGRGTRLLDRVFLSPGFTSYFETRLTSIPVVANGTNTSANSTASASPSCQTGSTGNGTTGGSSGANTASGNGTTCSFLTSPQTASVGIGVYFPYLVSRWDFKTKKNALFMAPLAKIGFNTITGATTQNVVLAGGGTGTQSYEQIYNFYGYGARVGHMSLGTSNAVAPEVYSYLDFVFGRYSNLESLVCHLPAQGGGPVPSGSGCKNYSDGSLLTYDSRKRLYRMDVEGLLKIPDTIFYVGLNANIGQKTFHAEKLDSAFKAPDDIRFLFGTKFDIATVFAKLGVTLP